MVLFLFVLEMTYLFGKVKNTGEVNMYPKPLQDLQGWQVRSMGCGTSSVVLAADNSVISFGAAPCFGELVSTIYLLYSHELWLCVTRQFWEIVNEVVSHEPSMKDENRLYWQKYVLNHDTSFKNTSSCYKPGSKAGG